MGTTRVATGPVSCVPSTPVRSATSLATVAMSSSAYPITSDSFPGRSLPVWARKTMRKATSVSAAQFASMNGSCETNPMFVGAAPMALRYSVELAAL